MKNTLFRHDDIEGEVKNISFEWKTNQSTIASTPLACVGA